MAHHRVTHTSRPTRASLYRTSLDFVDIDQLLQSDDDVMMRFQIYTLTGELKSSVDDGADVLLNHLNSVLTADGPNSAFKSVTGQLIQTTPGAGLLVTTNVVANDKSETDTNPSDGMNIPPTLPPVVHPTPEEIREELRRVWSDSGLGNVPYIPDFDDRNGNGQRDPDEQKQPGFDCDDYTEAYIEFARRNVFIGDSGINIQFEQLGYSYYLLDASGNYVLDQDGNRRSTGHAVVMVYIRGQIYILEPQNAEGGGVVGPIDPAQLEMYLRRYVPGELIGHKRRRPGSMWNNEVPAWWNSQPIRERVEPHFNHPPAFYIPNLPDPMWN